MTNKYSIYHNSNTEDWLSLCTLYTVYKRSATMTHAVYCIEFHIYICF